MYLVQIVRRIISEAIVRAETGVYHVIDSANLSFKDLVFNETRLAVTHSKL